MMIPPADSPEHFDNWFAPLADPFVPDWGVQAPPESDDGARERRVPGAVRGRAARGPPAFTGAPGPLRRRRIRLVFDYEL